MSLQKIITAIKKLDLGDSSDGIMDMLDVLKDAEKETRSTLKDYEALKSTIGDHDLGEVVGLYDALDKKGLTSAQAIVDLQNKADGSQQTIEELRKAEEVLKIEMAEGTQKASEALASAEKRELIADAKTQLISFYSSSKAADMGILDDVKGGKITRDESGGLLWGGKSLSDSVDDMKKDREFLFQPDPSGTGIVSTPSNNGQGSGSGPITWAQTIAAETK